MNWQGARGGPESLEIGPVNSVDVDERDIDPPELSWHAGRGTGTGGDEEERGALPGFKDFQRFPGWLWRGL